MNFNIVEQKTFSDVPFDKLFQEIAKSIQRMRVAKQITQLELAKFADVSLRSIKNLETGNAISMTVFLKVLYKLGETEYFLKFLNNPHFEDLNQDFIFGTGKASSKRYRKKNGQ